MDSYTICTDSQCVHVHVASGVLDTLADHDHKPLHRVSTLSNDLRVSAVVGK